MLWRVRKLFPRQPFFFGVVPLALCITDAVVFGQSFSTTLFDRGLNSSGGLAHHLDAHRRIAAGGQLRSLGRHTRPEFEPKVSDAGSQRVPLLTGHERQWRADAVINGGSKTV